MSKFDLYLSWIDRPSTSLEEADLILLCRDVLPKWDAERECLKPQLPHKFVLVSINNVKEISLVVGAMACVSDGSPILQKMLRCKSSSRW